MSRVAIDPENSDIAKKAVDYFSEKFILKKPEYRIENTKNQLTDQQKNQPNLKLQQKEYSKNNVNFPKINLHKNCIEKSFWMSGYKNYKSFPSEIQYNRNEIDVCTNYINSEKEFKEIFTRDLLFLYLTKQDKQQTLDSKACNVYMACKFSLKEIHNLDDDNLLQNSKLCTRLFAKYRIPNSDSLPLDIWIEKIQQSVDNNLNCYNKTPF